MKRVLMAIRRVLGLFNVCLMVCCCDCCMYSESSSNHPQDSDMKVNVSSEPQRYVYEYVNSS
uniref:Uncharacterized protein n=1 Tax=viral metagenome TaxID=1070528 RepID=A0A6C0BN41_9ZZZZ